MSERNPFEQHPRGPGKPHGTGRDLRCEEWEALLVDALDGLMPVGESASFEAHSHECAACATLLAQSRQGREWLEFLYTEPDMPADIVDRILAHTSGAVAERPLAVYGAPIAAGPNVMALPRRRFLWDTRLMMTAAMAFFSIALTLNLAGVRLTDLRLSDLTPASLESNLTRQFYGAKTQLVRYYDNLRFVYEVESKMRELRRDEDTQRPAPVQTQPEQKAPAPQTTQPAGGSPANPHKNGGKLEPAPVVPQPDVIFGKKMLASATVRDSLSSETRSHCPAAGEAHDSKNRKLKKTEVNKLVAFLRDQAERGLV
jgi:hypothetical protein